MTAVLELDGVAHDVGNRTVSGFASCGQVYCRVADGTVWRVGPALGDWDFIRVGRPRQGYPTCLECLVVGAR